MSASSPAVIGIVVALDKEAACLAGRRLTPDRIVQLEDGCRLLLCGDGPERAARAAIELLNSGVTHLLSIGTAGALDPVFAPGDLIVPEQVIRDDRILDVDARWRDAVFARLAAAPGAAAGGSLLTVAHAIARREDKSAARRESGAAAVDMESAAVLELAAARNSKALALRVVLDAASTDLPQLILDNCDPYGRPRLAAMGAALVRNPRQMVPFLRIAQAFAAASRTLRWIGRNRERLLPPD
jgi:adenosylhomocysteine nucleosidase